MTVLEASSNHYPAADSFHITLTQVNWLGQVVNLVYLPMAFLIPTLTLRYGIRKLVRLPVSGFLLYSLIHSTVHCSCNMPPTRLLDTLRWDRQVSI